jgi:hypothetical protein
MSSEDSEFVTALKSGSMATVLRVARMMSPLSLGDAARVLRAVANADDCDVDWFERAAVRWLVRFCMEYDNVTLADAAQVVAALDGLDGDPGALQTLIGLTQR